MSETGRGIRSDRVDLRFLRDDSQLAHTLGQVAPGALPPLLPALAAALLVGVLLVAELGRLSGITLFAPVAALLMSGLACGHPHDGRADWLVPPVLRATEYGYLVALGLASGAPGPVVFVVLVAIALHHGDDVLRSRLGVRRPDWVRRAALGWDGRMLFVAAGGLLDAVVFAFGVLAGYLAVLLVWEAVRTWCATPATSVDVPRGRRRRNEREAWTPP